MGRLPERDTKNLSKSFRDCDDSRQSHEMQKGETSCRGGSKHGKKAVSSATTGLEKAVKGRFGKQVTAAFSKKSRMLVSF